MKRQRHGAADSGARGPDGKEAVTQEDLRMLVVVESILQLDYYNPKTVAWEPLIEQWRSQFIVSVRTTPDTIASVDTIDLPL